MARTFNGNTANYFSDGPIYDLPTSCTILWRAKTSDNGSAMSVMGRRNSGGFAVRREPSVSAMRITYFGVADIDSNADAWPADGNWHAFAITKSGTGLTFYADNTTAKGTATQTYGTAATFGLYVGGTNDTGSNSNPFNGDLAEIAIFNRVLNGTELQDWMDGDSPLFYDTDLAYYWKLDETSGDAADSGPSNDTLTLNGTLASATHPTMTYPSAGPVLTSPIGTATGTTTATIGATTDTATGTLYGFVSTSATPPSAANLKAGTGAVWSGSVAVSSTGAKTLSATGLSAGTGYYAHLIHTDGSANDSNIVTSAQFTTDALTKYLKVLCHSSAQSATGVKGAVFEAPTGGALTGTKIGEFSSASFESSLESGQAVLKVAVSSFGGGSLTTSSTPVVVFEGTTSSGSSLGNAQPFGSVGVHEATVIEE